MYTYHCTLSRASRNSWIKSPCEFLRKFRGGVASLSDQCARKLSAKQRAVGITVGTYEVKSYLVLSTIIDFRKSG